MESTPAVTVSQKMSKKEVRKLVYAKISGALAEYKEGMKEKRFVSNLKKASRLFAADIAKTIGKKKSKVAKAKKKTLAAAKPAKAS